MLIVCINIVSTNRNKNNFFNLNNTIMENLVRNAKNQFKRTNQVIITVYPNRDYSSSCIEKFNSLDDAIEFIGYIYSNMSDDIHVSN